MDMRETRVIKKKGILPGKHVFVLLFGFVGVLAIASGTLWLTEHKVLAVAITAFFFFSVLLLWTLGAFAAGCLWSFKQYEAGADLAMRGKEVEGEQAVALVTGMTRLVDAVIRNAPRLAPPQNPPMPTFDRPEDFAPALQHLRPGRLLTREESED